MQLHMNDMVFSKLFHYYAILMYVFIKVIVEDILLYTQYDCAIFEHLIHDSLQS